MEKMEKVITNYQTIFVPETLKNKYIKRNKENIIKQDETGFVVLHQRPSGIYEKIEYLYK